MRSRKLTAPSPGLADSLAAQLPTYLEAAAQALAERLRRERLPRQMRRRARALLARAFSVLQAGAADLALLREVDRLAWPLRIEIAFRRRIGVRWPRGALDRALVERLWAPERWAEVRLRRVERFLAVTGAALVEGSTGEPRSRDLGPIALDLPLG